MIAHSRHLGNGRTLHQYRGNASNQYILEDNGAGSTYLIDRGMPSDAPGLENALKNMPPLKRGFPEDRVYCFANGDHVPPGFKTLPTPGHRPDHVAYLDPKSGALICGDFMIVINGRIVPNSFLASPKDLAASIDTIRNLPGTRSIWPGHGNVRPFDYNLNFASNVMIFSNFLLASN